MRNPCTFRRHRFHLVLIPIKTTASTPTTAMTPKNGSHVTSFVHAVPGHYSKACVLYIGGGVVDPQPQRTVLAAVEIQSKHAPDIVCFCTCVVRKYFPQEWFDGGQEHLLGVLPFFRGDEQKHFGLSRVEDVTH
eukprot:m.42122 g.42122  ORF g.42122 m.42122 type:complete len:134 (-) comp15009_c0_seq1:1354-1755(-)